MTRHAFQDMSVGYKLLLTTFLTVSLALFCFLALSITKETFDWQSAKLQDMASDVDLIDENAASALLSNRSNLVEHDLAALWTADEMTYGAVYDGAGRLFSEAGIAGAKLKRVGPAVLRSGHSISWGQIAVFKPIVYRGTQIGTLYLADDMHGFYSDILSDAGISLLAAMVAFGLAASFLLWLRPAIVNPLANLAQTMRTIAREKNYNLRVAPEGHDEIGILADTFNQMLDAIQERDVKVAGHQHELEKLVEQRTSELNDANKMLEGELAERKAAQESLHAHDTLLKTVTRSAAELLSSLNLDNAIGAVLDLMGSALGVSRIMISPVAVGEDGHYIASMSHEWFAPGRRPLMDNAILENIDLTTSFPRAVAATTMGDPAPLDVQDMPQPYREIYGQDGIRSFLVIPITVEKRLWGGLLFLDSSQTRREWSWAETDTLSTLANLIAAAVTRARTVKELADANTIVQNSPTVLYRLKGEPTLPLTYISHNITKFGYDPKTLTASEKFFQTLVHPEDLPRLQAAMGNILARNASGASIEFRLLLPGGTFRWVENRCTSIRDNSGRLLEIEGIIIDITERKAAEEKIALLARTDPLTGLANRATFIERLHQSFIAAGRGAPRFAVLYLDLDHFKDINDTRGHPVGDQLLREASARLKGAIRETDLVARLGGDEFAILQNDISDASDSGSLASKISEVLSKPYRLDNSELHVTASIGISYFMPETEKPDDMLAQADLALYRAKEDGRDQYRFHSEELDKEVSERVAMAEELRRAIARNEMEVYYQPQVELHSGNIVGMEALVRWHHPFRGLLMPAAFIPVAEKTGTILAIGHDVLRKACLQMKAWRAEGMAPPVLSVNISLAQLKAGAQFVRDVTETLAEAGIPPSDLELDVTESMLAQTTLAQNDVLDRLRQLGIRIALDDFGAEYSSFDYLRTYRVNHLKVARSFVEKATKDPQQAATIRAIIGAARELGIQVIAEGVETQEQRALLVSIGSATRGQGFYFSEAVDAVHASELLRKGVIDGTAKHETAA